MTKKSTQFDDQTLMAFVDGQLDPKTTMAVADALEADPSLAARITVFEQSADAARNAMASVMESDTPKHLVDAAQKVEDTLSAHQAMPVGKPKPFSVVRRLRAYFEHRPVGLIAAGFASAAVLFILAGDPPEQAASPTQANALPAPCSTSAFAQTLETQLSGSVSTIEGACDLAVTATLVPVGEEPFCRVFQIKAREIVQSGVACRTATETWEIKTLDAGSGQQGFATASGDLDRETITSAVEVDLIQNRWAF